MNTGDKRRSGRPSKGSETQKMARTNKKVVRVFCGHGGSHFVCVFCRFYSNLCYNRGCAEMLQKYTVILDVEKGGEHFFMEIISFRVIAA